MRCPKVLPVTPLSGKGFLSQMLAPGFSQPMPDKKNEELWLKHDSGEAFTIHSVVQISQ
jgi:hypothetical protein